MDHEKLSFLDAESRQYVEEISNKIRDNRVILFAGAGLSRNAQRKDGKLDKKFPLWEDLSKEMLSRLYGKDEKRIEKEKRFYLETADKFEAVFGRTALLHLLDEMLEEYKIPIIASSVGGKQGRKIVYNTESGEIKQKFIQRTEKHDL
ncbi:MAG: hypothetical protein MUF15_20795 [Acidobacteria bacterium]|nr:hypothetical protein [Acidobacteriota bacterium]